MGVFPWVLATGGGVFPLEPVELGVGGGRARKPVGVRVLATGGGVSPSEPVKCGRDERTRKPVGLFGETVTTNQTRLDDYFPPLLRLLSAKARSAVLQDWSEGALSGTDADLIEQFLPCRPPDVSREHADRRNEAVSHEQHADGRNI